MLEALPVLVRAIQANVSDLQGEPVKLMPLNYTLRSLRTTHELGGFYLGAQRTVQPHA